MRVQAAALGAAFAAVLAMACKGSEAERKPSAHDAAAQAAPTQVVNHSIDAFFRRGTPTLVRGTAGDDRSDRQIEVQIGLVRGLALPKATVRTDAEVVASWPERPVLYGGSHQNSALARAKPPYRVDADAIEIGGHTFEGPGYRLAAWTPASATAPEFVVLAGTGPAGIAEINAGLSTNVPISVYDRFGLLTVGSWKRVRGELVAELRPLRRRIEYRTVVRELDGVPITFEFPKMVALADGESAVIDAAMRGLSRAVTRLEIAKPEAMVVTVYPDRESKRQLTGNNGDGHAVPSSSALHVLSMAPEQLESLVAHEGAHVLGYHGWGPAGTALMGEGMAVWVAGRYGGKPIAKAGVAQGLSIEQLVGVGWRGVAEGDKYPAAARVFAAAVERVGLAKVREHLYGATFETFGDACGAAGTSVEELGAALR